MAGYSKKARFVLACVGAMGIVATFILYFPSPARMILGEEKFRFGLPSWLGLILIAVLI